MSNRVGLPAQLPPVNIKAGDVWEGIRIRISDDSTPPVPLDLTQDWSGWRCQFRPSPGSGQMVQLNVDDSDAANGWIGINADPMMTQAMGGPGGFDLEADGPNGPKTWVECTEVNWKADYTR